MRTNNLKVKNIIISVYFILIVLAILFATIFRAFSDLTDNAFIIALIIAFTFALLFFLVHYISKYFEYDSDGIKVIFINRGLLLSDHFNYREHQLEIEKNQLVAFKFKNFLVLKMLFIYYTSSHGNQKVERFNVTLVARKKRRYIRQSLSKIIKNNRKPTEW